MKLLQIIQAPANMQIFFNGVEWDENDEPLGVVGIQKTVIGYGLYSDGTVLPLVEGEKGALEPVLEENYVRSWIEEFNEKIIDALSELAMLPPPY